MTQAEAVQYIRDRVNVAEYPVLTDIDMVTIVSNRLRYSTWAASTAYAYGARVVPVAPNGRMYRCVRPGTSGATAPSWPEWPTSHMGYTLADGAGNLQWEDDGPAASAYNLRGMLYDAWMLKAGRASGDFDVRDRDADMRRSQVLDHCRRMAFSLSPHAIF